MSLMLKTFQKKKTVPLLLKKIRTHTTETELFLHILTINKLLKSSSFFKIELVNIVFCRIS